MASCIWQSYLYLRYIAEDQDDLWVEFAEKPNDSKYPAEVIGEENDT